MTDSRRLEINPTEDFPHLAHPPIVEAVIDIRARVQVPWEESAIAPQLRQRLPDYPKVTSQGRVQHKLTIGPSEPRYVVDNMGWHGLCFQSGDGKQVAQFTRDGFTFGRFQPYQNWEQLFREALRLWQFQLELGKPLEIHRVGLRFINRIEMSQNVLSCAEYIVMHPEPTSELDLPVAGFFHQDTLVVPGHPLAINVIRTIQPPQAPNTPVAVILDIEVVTTAAFEVDQSLLGARLREMRWLKNKIFFDNITEKALNSFK